MLIGKILCSFALFHVLSVHCFSQEIVKEWKIDQLILTDTRGEYLLTPINKTEPLEGRRRFDYGNHVQFREDGTFHSWYTAPCGNDCFNASHGRCTLKDEDHILLTIDTVYRHGDCYSPLLAQTFPLTPTLFYIQKEKDTIRLIKSDGNLEQDKLNVSYIEFIEAYTARRNQYSHHLKSISPREKTETSPENIAQLYAESAGINDYKILYAQERFNGVIVLIECGDERKCIYSRSSLVDVEGKEWIDQIDVFDTEFIDQINERVEKVNEKIRKYKREISEEEVDGVKEKVTRFRRGKEIEKVVLTRSFTGGSTTIEYYLTDSTAYFIKLTHNSTRSGSIMEFYLGDPWKLVTREVVRSGVGIHHSEIHTCKEFLKRIMEK